MSVNVQVLWDHGGGGVVRDVDFEETVAADSEVAGVFAAGLKSVGIDI